MSMGRLVVSVIMPVYNAEKYLKDSISDLLVQSYSDLEIILVNDGSTDRSYTILKEYELKDSRIKVISNENRGVSYARNIGLKIATGDYVRFVDADDRIPKDSIEKLLQPFMENELVDLVIGNYLSIPESNYMLGEIFREGTVDSKEFFQMFMKYTKSFYFGVPWNKLYKRKIIIEQKLKFDENVFWSEDFLFNVSYYQKCRKISLIKTETGVYTYYKRKGSISETLFYNERVNCDYIEKLRYNAIVEYGKQFEKEEAVVLEWKYSDLFEKLSKIPKKKYKNAKIKDRYIEFKSLLCNKDVYNYVCMKKDANLKIWKMIKKSIEKKRYGQLFLLFYAKGWISAGVGVIVPTLQKRFQNKLPKNL